MLLKMVFLTKCHKGCSHLNHSSWTGSENTQILLDVVINTDCILTRDGMQDGVPPISLGFLWLLQPSFGGTGPRAMWMRSLSEGTRLGRMREQNKLWQESRVCGSCKNLSSTQSSSTQASCSWENPREPRPDQMGDICVGLKLGSATSDVSCWVRAFWFKS